MLDVGTVVAGRYRLDALIGQGAMGTVYRAFDETLGRQVAIKLLVIDGSSDPKSMVDQFLREARIAAAVQHRNVIHTIDFGTIEGEQPYMVMELLSGLSLEERMEQSPRMSAVQLLHLVSLTLRGLTAVHDAGIVHRDLKPANIFLQSEPEGVFPKILDFGISRSLASSDDRRSAISTQRGMIVGTPDYMAPEQARGETNITRAADIYAIGAILYEGLSGQLPFDAQNVGDLIVQIVTAAPRPIAALVPDLPTSVIDVIEQAMSKDPTSRFVDARAMRKALTCGLDEMRSGAGSRGPRRVVSDSERGMPAESLLPESPSSASAWGGFEGLAPAPPALGVSVPPPPPPSQAARPPQRVSVPPPTAAVGMPPVVAGLSPGLGPQARGFGGFDAAAPARAMLELESSSMRPLELDLGPTASPLAQLSVSSAARGGRVSRPDAMGSFATTGSRKSGARAIPTRARRRSHSFAVPVLGGLLLLLWIAVPHLIITRLPAEVRSPALEESYPRQRELQRHRRRDPGHAPPALRDVVFD